MYDQKAALQAEQAVLGACLINQDAILRVMSTAKPEYFSEPAHQQIFRAMLDCTAAGQPIDPVVMADKAGGHMMLIADLIAGTPGSANVEHYAKRVVGFWRDRELARVGREIQELAMNGTGDKISAAMQLLMSVADGAEDRGYVHVKTCMNEVLDYLEERQASGSSLIGSSTGLEKLDETLHGIRPGMLYIIAGRPGMGKTTVAMNIARTVALEGQSVYVHSLEMPRRELCLRLASDLGGVSFDRVQSAKLNDEEWPALTAGVTRIMDKTLFIDDTPGLTLAGLYSKAKRAALTGGKIGCLIVDYIGLMKGDGQNRTQEIGAISRGLKALAKELGCPILCLAQLNRGCEDRTDKRPLMADLRDSGEIEQDADAVIMVYRDSVYNPDSDLAHRQVAELLVRKNRHGKTAEIMVLDQLDRSRYVNIHPSALEGLGDHKAKKVKSYE